MFLVSSLHQTLCMCIFIHRPVHGCKQRKRQFKLQIPGCPITLTGNDLKLISSLVINFTIYHIKTQKIWDRFLKVNLVASFGANIPILLHCAFLVLTKISTYICIFIKIVCLPSIYVPMYIEWHRDNDLVQIMICTYVYIVVYVCLLGRRKYLY